MATPSAVAGVVRHLQPAADDPELLNRYVMAGDEGAFAALVARYGGLVLGVARRQLADPGRSEDVFQATFLALARAAGRLRRKTPLADWLFAVARRQGKKAGGPSPPEPPASPTEAAISPDLLARTVALGAAPWATTIPPAVESLVAPRKPGWLLPAALAAGVLAAGLGAWAAVGRKPNPVAAVAGPAQAQPPVAAPVAGPAALPVPAADDPLPDRAVLRFGSARFRHPTDILSLAYAPDGRWAVAGSGCGGGGNCDRSYDLADGRVLARYTAPDFTAEALAVSPDGDTVLTRTSYTYRLFDPLTGRERRKFDLPDPKGHYGTSVLLFTPDGRHAVSTYGTESGLVLVDLDGGAIVRRYPFDPKVLQVVAAAVSPDGKLLAGIADAPFARDGSGRVWEVETGREVRRFDAGRPHRGSAVAFSPDGRLMVAGSDEEGSARVYEAATGRTVHALPGRAVSAAFAPDGKTVAVAGLEQVAVFDTATGAAVLTIPRPTRHLRYAPDGESLLGAVGNVIVRWDAATGRRVTPDDPGGSPVGELSVSPDGRRLLTVGRFMAGRGGAADLWDTRTGRRVGGRAGSDGGFAWDGETPPARWLGGLTAADGLTVIPNWVDGTVRLSRPGEPDRTFPLAGPDERPAFGQYFDHARAVLSPDGRALAVACYRNFPAGPGNGISTGVVRLYEVATGRLIAERMAGWADEDQARTGVTVAAEAVAFSPDGRLLAVGCDPPGPAMWEPHRSAKLLAVWDAATGRPVPRLANGLAPGALAAAFAPDGRTLATGNPDGTVSLWEVATWGVRAVLRGHGDRVTALAFGPDGRLYSGGNDTTAVAWDVRPAKAAGGLLDDAWKGLTDPDAGVGFAAMGRLVGSPGEAVELIAGRLPPAVAPDPAVVAKLVGQLGGDEFAARERASRELDRAGRAAADALRKAARTGSPEARRRAAVILNRIDTGTPSPDELRAARAVEVLEVVGSPAARGLLAKLAAGDPGAVLTREAAAAEKRIK